MRYNNGVPLLMIYTLTRDDIPLLSQWIKKSRSWERDFLVLPTGLEPAPLADRILNPACLPIPPRKRVFSCYKTPPGELWRLWERGGLSFRHGKAVPPPSSEGGTVEGKFLRKWSCFAVKLPSAVKQPTAVKLLRNGRAEGGTVKATPHHREAWCGTVNRHSHHWRAWCGTVIRLPLTRELSAKLTEGESYNALLPTLKSNNKVGFSPSVKNQRFLPPPSSEGGKI